MLQPSIHAVYKTPWHLVLKCKTPSVYALRAASWVRLSPQAEKNFETKHTAQLAVCKTRLGEREALI